MAEHSLLLELFYNGQWNVAPTYNGTEVTITRGCGDEQSDPTPASMTLAIKNRDGTKNPKNPTSPLYGVAGRNTPARLTLDGTDIRMTGEVASWKPRRTTDFSVGGQGNAWTDVVVTGVLRRIGQGTDPRSALRRTIAGSTVRRAIAYWPMEDGEDASRAASGIPGGSPMVIKDGLVNFETDGGPAGSAGWAAMVETAADVLTASIPAYTHTDDDWTVSFWAKGTGDSGGASYDEVTMLGVTTTTGYRYLIGMANGFELGQTAYATLFDPAGDVVDGVFLPAGTVPGLLDGNWHLIELQITDSGGGQVDLFLEVDGTLVDSVNNIEGTGRPAAVRTLDNIGFIEASNLGIDHIAFFVDDFGADGDQWAAGNGWAGETAADRVERLCAERGVGFVLIGDADDCQVMGTQQPATLTALLAETQLTDSGLVYDTRDALGLTFRTGRSRYNLTPALELDWSAHQVADPFEPTLDDQNTRNDVTVQRPGGSSARAVRETGPMNVQDPSDDPEGVGRTIATVDINPANDSALPLHAAWHLHLGTVDEIRYPQVTVDLDGSPGLAADVSAVDIGDLITIANLPADISPDLARLVVVGYTETLSYYRRKITFNCAPASPYDVATWDESAAATSARYDTEASTTSGSITTGTSTSVSVVTAAGHLPWTTNAAHMPIDINLLGARVRVTGVSGASSPQTFTISATVVNGVAKTIPSGTPVRPWKPARYGL